MKRIPAVLIISIALIFSSVVGCDNLTSTSEKTSDAPAATENVPSDLDLAGPKVSLADAGPIASKMADAGLVASRMNAGAAPEAASPKSGGGNVVQGEATLYIVDTPEGVPPQKVGTVSMTRKPANNTINWTLEAEGLGRDGHAWTIWWGNTPFTESGGYGGGGVIHNGQVTASNNHCTWTLETFWDGGFRPEKEPTCDRIDASGAIVVNLLIHDEWEPGDMMERWDPDGDANTADIGDPPGPIEDFPQCFSGENAQDECDAFKAPNRTLIAAFPALEE